MTQKVEGMTDDTLAEIDSLIRTGNFVGARNKLTKIPLVKVPERLVVKFADLLVRVGLFRSCSKLLYPHMFELKTKPEPKVVARYALALQQMGAYREALKLFSQLPFSSLPEANFYYAIALFAQWEYQQAIPYLETYINFPELNPYSRLVGNLNLAVAYAVVGELNKAKTILDDVEQKSKEQNHNLLLANSLEVRAQILFDEKNFKQALELLSTSDKLLKSVPSKYKVMVDFWVAINQYARDPEKKASSQRLFDLRREAVNLENWPIVREIDHHRAIIDRDVQLLLKVYFGTPFAAFRKKLLKDFKQKIEIPESYMWNPTEKKSSRQLRD